MNVHLTTEEAAEYLNLSASYLAALRGKGTGPRFVHFGPTLIRYRVSDLDAWTEARTYQSTAQAQSGAA